MAALESSLTAAFCGLMHLNGVRNGVYAVGIRSLATPREQAMIWA
jgi:hypothetical protein